MKYRILHYDTLASTNDLALSFARQLACEGTVVVSDYQTHGRGRFRRRWISPRGKGLLFSIVLRPNLKASSAPILTHLAAQSVAEVLKRRFHLPAKLKKPNDVLVGDKKIAGILTEASGAQDRLEYVIVGIGLNVNSSHRELLRKATSVYLETGQEVEKKPLLEEILSTFLSKYNKVKGKQELPLPYAVST